MTRAVWTPAFVGVGSNLDDPLSRVQRALDDLRALPASRCYAVSSLYASIAIGPSQPDYVNAAVLLLTQLTADELLRACQALEARQGRRRDGERWGPRTLDLDILLFGEAVMDGDDLTIPHPQLHKRDFVLGPLHELAPNYYVPGIGRIEQLAGRIDLTQLERLEATPAVCG